MEMQKAGVTGREKGEDANFAGTAWIRRGPEAEGTGGTGVVVVDFEPGTRTHWHSHPGGQFLYVVSGSGRVRSKDDATGAALSPGDMVAIPANEVHFHGAAPDAPLQHVAVNGGGAPNWGEPVTDEEYDQGF
jgi:quercetin dioxygenase-like cupin family protein